MSNVWGTIVSYWYQYSYTEAAVVCRQLGYNTYSETYKLYRLHSIVELLINVTCYCTNVVLTVQLIVASGLWGKRNCRKRNFVYLSTFYGENTFFMPTSWWGG